MPPLKSVPIREIPVDELKAGLADGSVLLIDVREPHEFAAGHIPGSVPLPLSRFDPGAVLPAPGKQVVFSCRTGVRSIQAIELARLHGFDVDTHFKPGFAGWAGMGEPVES